MVMTQVLAPACRKAPPLGNRAGRPPAGVVAALLAAAALGACSPALDWRQLRPEGWGLTLSLPCKPASHERQVPLAGAPVALRLMACSAEGHTFAVASADLVDPARVGPALQALGEAARANVQGQVEHEQAAGVRGMTPHPAARHWRLRGHLPDGQPVVEEVLVFAHGPRVFQVTLVGPQAGEALVRPFFDAVEVLP